jgi:hypothetical protein
MSKKINVNPDHYKTKGRERQGEDVVVAREKQALARALATGGGGRGRGKAAQPDVKGPAASDRRKKK